jgi:hypothetical protein
MYYDTIKYNLQVYGWTPQGSSRCIKIGLSEVHVSRKLLSLVVWDELNTQLHLRTGRKRVVLCIDNTTLLVQQRDVLQQLFMSNSLFVIVVSGPLESNINLLGPPPYSHAAWTYF